MIPYNQRLETRPHDQLRATDAQACLAPHGVRRPAHAATTAPELSSASV